MDLQEPNFALLKFDPEVAVAAPNIAILFVQEKNSLRTQWITYKVLDALDCPLSFPIVTGHSIEKYAEVGRHIKKTYGQKRSQLK